MVEYMESHNVYIRPPWSESVPYGGTVLKYHWGTCELKHLFRPLGLRKTWDRDFEEE